MIKYKKEIIELKAFEDVFKDMYKKDYKMAENIGTSLKCALKDTHKNLLDYTSNKEQYKIALLQEQIKIQSLANQYLKCYEDLLVFEQGLLKKMYYISDEYFNKE